MRAWIPLLALTLLSPLAAAASEIVATRLVFEKATKMKKIDAALYLGYEDVGDRLRCGAVARGQRGRIAAAGSFRLRLVGERANGAEAWESRESRVEIDDAGNAEFDVGEIAQLAATAGRADAEVSWYRVDFAGGRGGKVAEVTVDCLRDRIGP